jgi:hypothetical protein
MVSKGLDDLIRATAAKGELTYLSVIPKGDLFAATYCPASGFGHGFAEHADPVTAMYYAIKDYKRPDKREPKPEAAPAKEAEPWD